VVKRKIEEKHRRLSPDQARRGKVREKVFCEDILDIMCSAECTTKKGGKKKGFGLGENREKWFEQKPKGKLQRNKKRK